MGNTRSVVRSHRLQIRLRYPALLLSGLILLGIAGCSREGSQTSASNAPGHKRTIVFVFKVAGIPYSAACRRGAEEAAKKLGINVEYMAPQQALADMQRDMIETQIVRHPDAIVISPDDSEAIKPVIAEAMRKGIKVFTWDSDSKTSRRIFYVAAVDDVQIGEDIANALAKAINYQGKVLIMSGGRGADNLNKHVEGMEMAFSKYPGITVIKPVLYNDDDKSKAVNMAIEALQQHPDVAGIACANSPSPPACGEALERTGKIGKVKVWGLALPSETRPYLKDGSVTGLYLWNPAQLTYLAAVLVNNDLNGHPPVNGETLDHVGKITYKDGQVTLPIRLTITKQNVDQFNF